MWPRAADGREDRRVEHRETAAFAGFVADADSLVAALVPVFIGIKFRQRHHDGLDGPTVLTVSLLMSHSTKVLVLLSFQLQAHLGLPKRFAQRRVGEVLDACAQVTVTASAHAGRHRTLSRHSLVERNQQTCQS